MLSIADPSQRTVTVSRVPGRQPSSMLAAASCLLAAGLLAGCGGQAREKAASQTAAKVNKEEITVHQINFVLQQQRGLQPEQAPAASRQVLQRLIDQEVALQKAQEQRIDRDPRVLQEIEAARREVISRAYLEKVGAGAAHPSDSEISAYFDAHPALFQNRRIYNLQEIAIEAPPAQVGQLRTQLLNAKSVADFIAHLRANNIKFAVNQATRAAEQLPLGGLDALARLKDGESLFNPTPTGAQVVVVVSSTSQPVGLDRARPAIDQFMMAERKRKLIEDDIKSLRAAAKIELVGDFGKPLAAAASAPVAASEPEFAAARGSVSAGSSPSMMGSSGTVDSDKPLVATPMDSVATPTAHIDDSAASQNAR